MGIHPAATQMLLMAEMEKDMNMFVCFVFPFFFLGKQRGKASFRKQLAGIEKFSYAQQASETGLQKL